jgi:hypothetical protein
MKQGQLIYYNKDKLTKFLNTAIDSISKVENLEPSDNLLHPPQAMSMNFNVNYTSKDHDEMLYLSNDLEVVVVKLDTVEERAKVVFLKQIDFMMDLLPKGDFHRSFFLSIELVTEQGVGGYFEDGKIFQVAYVNIHDRRSFIHILELSKDPSTGQPHINLKLTIPVMETMLKLKYCLKESQMFSVCPLTGQKILKKEILEKYINNSSWHDDITSQVKFMHPGNYNKPEEKLRFLYFEFYSNFSFNKYRITTYRIYLNSGYMKRVSIHSSHAERHKNQNNLIFRNFTNNKYFYHHIYHKIGAHVVREFKDPNESTNSSDAEVSREVFTTTYNLESQKRIKTFKVDFDPRKQMGEYKDINKDFFRELLPQISSYIYYQDQE